MRWKRKRTRTGHEQAAVSGTGRKQTPVYIGLALGVVGFAVIGYAWDRAALLDCVQCQFPYLLSGSLTGLGLVIVGVGTLVLHTLRRDAEDRDAQMAKLTATVEAVATRLGPRDPYDPAALGEYRPRPRAETTNGLTSTKPTPTTGTWERA